MIGRGDTLPPGFVVVAGFIIDRQGPQSPGGFFMLKQDGFAPSENRLVLGMGKYSLHTVLDSSSTILFLSKGLYISSSTKKYITLDYLIIYTSYARVAKRVPTA